ncbi:MAG TPA: DUF4388 domain-containing protein [Planctomycetota bacterium]|nr:DUF4388 domain-containing protein [Planctomycetota bacterium]
MTFSGDLKGIGLTDVLQNVQTNRLSGVLRIEGRAGVRYVELKDGAITGLSLGPGKGLPLGEHLVHRGFVRKAQLQAACERRRSTRKTLREVLAQSGVLDEEGFRSAVRELISEHMHAVLGWTEATYSFDEGPPPPRVFDGEQRAANVRVEIGPLLMENARRADESKRIANVVESDEDVFVRTEVEIEGELDEVQAAVLEQLDGRTDVGTVVQRLPYLRFDVLKALAEVVVAGHARPCSAAEIEVLAEQACREGDDQGAAVLLRRALSRERNNQALRLRLVDVLLRLERHADAAAELALLGYMAARGDQPADAIDFYGRAAALVPDDLTIGERYVEALAAHGDPQEHAAAAADLAERLVAAGLAERAAAVLTAACARPELRADLALLGRLAQTEEALGHVERAAELWRGAADLCQNDVPGALQFLRRALRLQPLDAVLQRRIHDLETGYAAYARRRRRRLVALGTAASVAGLLGFAGIMELVAAREVIRSLDLHLEDVTRGSPAAAVAGLEQVGASLRWTGSGRTALRLAERLVELQVRAALDALEADRPDKAIAVLERLQGLVERKDQERRLNALLRQARLERHAHELLAAASGDPPLLGAARDLARLVDPELVAFHTRHVERVTGDARGALLEALRAIDSPRALPVAARLYLLGDPRHEEVLSAILQTAPRHRAAGAADAWRPVLPELARTAAEAGARAERARRVLGWLEGR